MKTLRRMSVLCMAALWMSAASAHAEPSALTQAREAITAHGYSPSRLLALGRAQLQAGQLGPAIVSLERGLMLAPRDAALRSELARAEQDAGIATAAQPWWARALHTLSLREWAFAASIAALVFSLGSLGFALTTRLRALSGTIVVLGALVCSLSAVAVVGLRHELARAFVLVPDGTVLQSPFANASVVAHVRAGEPVELRERHGDFVYVESDHGVWGWMKQSDVARLAAPEAPRT